MPSHRRTAVLAVGAFCALLAGCMGKPADAASAAGNKPIVKGGDNRYGEYTNYAADWWKPAPEHLKDTTITWGQASGLVADGPNRILVGFTGDRPKRCVVGSANLGGGFDIAAGGGRGGRAGAGGRSAGGARGGGGGGAAAGEGGRGCGGNGHNLVVAVDSTGKIIENWSQWDTLIGFPHQLYISPYDPERHIWIDDRGGGPHNVHEQILKFTNDGKKLVMRLTDPNPRMSNAEVRKMQPPGPLDFGQNAVIAFMPNGDFLVGDGYQNGRVARYDSTGKFLSQFGTLAPEDPNKPGQFRKPEQPGEFDLVHGVAVDKAHRIYVSDRDNDRIQVFDESGKFIEQWPDIKGPTGIYIDDREHAWVLSTTLNQILEFNLNGELLYQFGAYCCTRGGFAGGFSRPHQMQVDSQGNLYVANYDGGFVTKYVPKPGADPNRLVGQPLLIK